MEYIQDLEKYVEDNHSKYREAKLQLESYQQLHEENQKLRAMLDSQDVSDTQIDTLVNVHAVDYVTGQISLRNVHPNLQSETISAETALSVRLDAADDQILFTAVSISSPLVLRDRNSDIDELYLISFSVFEFQQPQYCYVFHIYFNFIMQAISNNSMLCSEAHKLINQYNITGQDIQYINEFFSVSNSYSWIARREFLAGWAEMVSDLMKLNEKFFESNDDEYTSSLCM